VRPIAAYWQTINPLTLSLLPLAVLFYLLVQARRTLYRLGLLRAQRLPVPVIVIGNLSVGGSGKSPLVVWLARRLKAAGYRPGILSRGYGGRATHWPRAVGPDSDPRLVGDEPVMIARLSGCPLFVAPDRVAAGRALLAAHPCDLLIADDGLQHYRLARDLEMAVIDGERRHGNGLPLPAGPLREPLSRLRLVHWRVAKGRALAGEVPMTYRLGSACSLTRPESRPLASFAGGRVHAIAGIGHPAAFFSQLRGLGLDLMEHPFPDHHPFRADEIRFEDDNPVLMTHKDAVKCEALAGPQHWFVPLEAELPEAFAEAVLRAVAGLLPIHR
jgi:tetraacyldisaccharide 4'-kinase